MTVNVYVDRNAISLNEVDQKKKETLLVTAIIAASLAGAVGIILSPASLQEWELSIGSVIITLVAGVKFGAMALACFTEKKRILGVLWGVLAIMFVLLLLAELQRLIELAGGG